MVQIKGRISIYSQITIGCFEFCQPAAVAASEPRTAEPQSA